MRTSTREEYRARIERVVQHVLDRIDNPPTPQELADHAGFSRFHFGRIFSGATGEPLAEFVRRIRLERAAWRLINTDTSVGDQAMDAGYTAIEAFSRAFRAEYRMTPSEFQARPSRHEIACLNGVHWHPETRAINLRLAFDEESFMDITIKDMEPIRLIAFPHSGPYHGIGAVFGRIYEWAGRNGAPMGVGVGVYYDDPHTVTPHELRSHAGIMVPEGYEPPRSEGAPEVVTLPAGKYAVATHIGPYEGLPDAWPRFVGQAIPAGGHEIADSPAFEMYMNDCSQVAPEEVRTDLYVMLK